MKRERNKGEIWAKVAEDFSFILCRGSTLVWWLSIKCWGLGEEERRGQAVPVPGGSAEVTEDGGGQMPGSRGGREGARPCALPEPPRHGRPDKRSVNN